MMRVSLVALCGLAFARSENGVARRLQGEKVQLRRRNVVNDAFAPLDFGFIGDGFVWVGDVFEDGWNTVDDWFSHDFVDWWENDFVNFLEKSGEGFQTAGETTHLDDVGQWSAGFFTDGWDGFVDVCEVSWDWTKNAAIDAYEWTDDFFYQMGCAAEMLVKVSCIKCVKDACNSNLSDETIKKIDDANSVALMAMNDQFDPFLNGCAQAMESCPTVEDCKAFNSLPESAKKYMGKQLSKCSLCYMCLPYGSTEESCQKALDQVMPNSCEGCSDSDNAMYKAFYSCSSVKSIVDSVEKLGNSYKEGEKAHESLDSLCKYCSNCSKYTESLKKTCGDWYTISAQPEQGGWDYKAPEVPSALMPPF